jgi:hypothetical protein
MRTSKKKQLVNAQRKTQEQKRSAESKVRKEKRKAKGKAEEIAKAVKRGPAGRKVAETLKAKREVARGKEQANCQKTGARAATRIGGRRKTIQAELHAKLEE